MLFGPVPGLLSPWTQDWSALATMDLGQLLTPAHIADVFPRIGGFTAPSTSRGGEIVVAACVQCRSKKVKCDGLHPCARCQADSQECNYIPSRRGYQGPRKPAGIPTTDGDSYTTPRAAETKPRLTYDEVARLELTYKTNRKPNSITKAQLAEEMGVDVPRINNWFQNRRAKEKQLIKTAKDEMETARAVQDQSNRKDEAIPMHPLPISQDPVGMITMAANTSHDEDDWRDNEEIIGRLLDHFYTLMGHWYFKRPTQGRTMTNAVQQHNGGPSRSSDIQQSRNTSTENKQKSSGDRVENTNYHDSDLIRGRGRPEGDDEDSKEERRRKKPRIRHKDKDTGVSQQRLACPYFKRSATQYQLWRSCPGPGWGTVHRVKEHLYRCHVLPPSCPRCHETFDDEKAKLNHLVAVESCTVRDPPSASEGLDPATHELLKSRKLLQGHETEEAKWRAVYLLLFPDTKEKDIPSPYYEYASSVVTNEDPESTGVALEFTKYEQFLTAELPTHIKQKITTRVGTALGPPGSTSTRVQIEALKQEVIDMVRDAQIELFRVYCRTRGRFRPFEETPAPVPTSKSASSYGDDEQGFHVPRGLVDNHVPGNHGGAPDSLVDAAPFVDGGYFDLIGFDGIVYDLGGLGSNGAGLQGEAIQW